MGDDATREIVRLFLEDFPVSLERLTAGGKDEQQRIAHGIKSSALHMGATDLSQRMARIEELLGSGKGTLSADELAAVQADFAAIAPSLRRYTSA